MDTNEGIRAKDILPHKTSFSPGDGFYGDGYTSFFMEAEKLIELTAQNALAGNVAQAFVPNSTTTVAGLPYIYGGLLYVAKDVYQGAWDATKFYRVNSSNTISTVLNLNEGYWWKIGTRHTPSGMPLYYVTNAIFTDLLSFNRLATISLTKAAGVSFNLTLFAFDKNCNYLGFDNTSKTLYNLSSILNAYPSAQFVSIAVNSIVGASIDLEDLSNIVTFGDIGKTIINAYVNPYAFKDLANWSEKTLTFNPDLNDPKYWLVRGLSASGYVDNDNSYQDRVTSVLLPLTDDTKIQYSVASGVTLYERVYAYNNAGVYLGYVQNASYVSSVKVEYPTAYYYRIYLYGISGTTAQADSIANIATFDNSSNKVVGVEKNLLLGEVTGDRVIAKQIGEKRSIRHLCNKTTLPCFSFTFDGPYPQDKEVVALFDEKGVRCGFAFVADDSRLQFYTEEFLKYQSRGYEIINHNLNGKRITTEDYATYDLAYADLLKAKELLVNRGFVVNGFIAPRSVISDSYKSIIGKLHAYGFIGNAGANDQTADVCLLNRYGIETPTEQTIKDFIDDCIANNKYCCLYAHTNNFGVDDFSLNKVKNILEYVIAKRDAGLCAIDIPTEMVAQYYSLN